MVDGEAHRDHRPAGAGRARPPGAGPAPQLPPGNRASTRPRSAPRSPRRHRRRAATTCGTWSGSASSSGSPPTRSPHRTAASGSGEPRRRGSRSAVHRVPIDPPLARRDRLSVCSASTRRHASPSRYVNQADTLDAAWQDAAAFATYGLAVTADELRDLTDAIDALIRPFIAATRADRRRAPRPSTSRCRRSGGSTAVDGRTVTL